MERSVAPSLSTTQENGFLDSVVPGHTLLHSHSFDIAPCDSHLTRDRISPSCNMKSASKTGSSHLSSCCCNENCGSAIYTDSLPPRRSLSLQFSSNDGSQPVYQAKVPSNKTEVVEIVVEQSWLITKLSFQLLWALRMSSRWIICFLRLVFFVICLLPAFLKILHYLITSPHVYLNLIYGLEGRNLLDVYVVPTDDPVVHAASEAAVQKIRRKRSESTDPPPSQSTGQSKYASLPKHPVVVLFSGGAWIIGYKGWGALIGKVLSRYGVVVVTPDYRNFPQGTLPQMIDDVTLAMQWVFDNIQRFGGDPENVTVMGQSAGAHLAMCAMLERLEVQRMRAKTCTTAMLVSQSIQSDVSSGHRSPNRSVLHHCTTNVPKAVIRWELSQIRSFIGVSGAYNIGACLEPFHRHGFDKRLVERIMDHRSEHYSPTLRFQKLYNQQIVCLTSKECEMGIESDVEIEVSEVGEEIEPTLQLYFPPCFLFHGTKDKTVHWSSTKQLAQSLKSCGVMVETKYFRAKTHTDPIVEDPIVGDDFLLEFVMRILREHTRGGSVDAEGFLKPSERYYPAWLIRLARYLNPF